MQDPSSLLSRVQIFLDTPIQHNTTNKGYITLEDEWISFLRNSFQSDGSYTLDIFGQLCRFQYVKQGAVDTANLLGLFEIMLFKWYYVISKFIPKCKAIDIGSNIGVHSLFLAKLFDSVDAYDPDQNHRQAFEQLLSLNNVLNKVSLHNLAVTSHGNGVTFTRVLGNPTASYVDGLKTGYGPLQELEVSSINADEAVGNCRLCKIDAEGAELQILTSISSKKWDQGLICFFEISTAENREPIFDYLRNIGVSIYTQLICWNEATSFNDLPSTWRDGNCAAFIKSDLNTRIYNEFMN